MSPDNGAPAPLVCVAGWGGESQLLTLQDIVPGALLLAEQPVAFAETRADEDELGPWILLETLLSSPPMLDSVSRLDLKMTQWPLSAQDEQALQALAQKYGRNPRKLAPLYHRIASNNLRYAEAGVSGYGIWPTISRSNHSCQPNARLCAARQQPLVELLLATQPIAKGEAVCWNYYSDEAFLALDWFERNLRLRHNFRFVCRCPRCLSEMPPQAAALSGQALAALFDQALQA